MKKFIAVFFAAMLAVSTWAQPDQDWAKLQRYEAENQEVIKAGGAKVVFLGNSITQNWRKLRPEFFEQNGYVGRGISGQTSCQFLVRFRQDVINLSPKLVVINAGTNDIAENTGTYNEDYTFGNIVSMVELAKANKIKVIMTTVLPAAQFRWRPSVEDPAGKIAGLNARLKAYAKKSRIPFVDYYTPMVFGEERALNPAYSNDGVHPTPAGYEVMEPLIKAAIEKAL